MKQPKKPNSRGFSHHFLLPIIAIVAVGAIGLVTLNLSSAATKTYTVTKCKSIGTIRTGSRGSCVRVLQKSLNKWGGAGKLSVDGMFGGQTRNAVKKFQSKKNLTVDGVVGQKTWGALTKYPASVTIKTSSSSSSSAKKTSSNSTEAKKKACNGKAGMVWTSSGCKNLRKVCVDNDGKWNESAKKCTTEKQKKTVPKPSCVPGYINRADTGECVKKGAACSKPPLAKPTWHSDGKCRVD